MHCAEPSNLSASGSEDVQCEQHLTGRNKQKRYLDLQAKLLRDVDGLFNVRVECSIKSGVRGRDWGIHSGVGYPVLTGSLDRCTCSYIDIMGSAVEDHPICGGFSLSSHSLATSTSIGPGYQVDSPQEHHNSRILPTAIMSGRVSTGAKIIRSIVKNDSVKSDPPEIYGWRAFAMAGSACFGGMLFGFDIGTIGGVLELKEFQQYVPT